MSRIGNRPVQIPSGVEVKFNDGELHVKGPKGELKANLAPEVAVEVSDSDISFKRSGDKTAQRAMHGLMRALVGNMVHGVSEGFTKELEILGVGYRAESKGKTLNLLLGFSHPVEMPVPEGLKVSVGNNTKLKIEGIDKQQVGQFAADIRSLRPPEPYKGKGVRYADEHVRRKVGKTGAA